MCIRDRYYSMQNVCSDCDLFLIKHFNVLVKAYVNKINEKCKNDLVKLQPKNIKLKKISHN